MFSHDFLGTSSFLPKSDVETEYNCREPEGNAEMDPKA